LLERFAFIATIAYLALQVKQNTKAVKASAHHAITDSFNNISIQIIQNPEVGRVWRLGNERLSNLTEDELVSFSFMNIAYMRVFETLYYQRKIGTMEEQLYIAEEQTLRWVFTQPGFIEWWESNPISFSVEYREYIAGLIDAENT